MNPWSFVAPSFFMQMIGSNESSDISTSLCSSGVESPYIPDQSAQRSAMIDALAFPIVFAHFGPE